MTSFTKAATVVIRPSIWLICGVLKRSFCWGWIAANHLMVKITGLVSMGQNLRSASPMIYGKQNSRDWRKTSKMKGCALSIAADKRRSLVLSE
jgi:hypothetical protein